MIESGQKAKSAVTPGKRVQHGVCAVLINLVLIIF